MADPSFSFQIGMADQLLGDPAVTAWVGNGVYAEVPAQAELPYLSIGDDQIVGLDEVCKTASEIVAQVHVWAAGSGRTLTARKIAGAVRTCLTAEFAVDGFEIVLGEFQGALHLDDPSGFITHTVLTFRYLIDPL